MLAGPVGEPLRGVTVRALREQAPGAALWNLYGSTEVAGDVTAHLCRAEDERLPRVPAGTPLPNVEVLVAGPDGGTQGTGCEGEVIVRGAALARGYVGQPGETARRFRAVAADDPAAGREFATGDLGYFDDDGRLHLLGRRDRQLKVRGVRVEPAEAEAMLAAHPAIRHAAVDVRRLDDDIEHLIAWVEYDAGRQVPPAGAELARALSAALPSAAVPDLFVPVQPWPRTPTGKTDRAALPDVSLAARPGARLPGSPGPVWADAVEREVAEVWRTRLVGATVTEDCDFFELGGTSLLAILVAEELSERFGAEIAVRDIFDNRTVRKLAAIVSCRRDGRT